MTDRFEAMGTVFEKADKHPGVIVPVSGHIYEIEKAAREAQAAEFQRIDAWVEEKQGDLDKPHSVTVGYTEAFWWHRHLTAKGFEVGGLPDDLAEENLRVETRPQEVALTVRRREEPDEGDDDIETLGGPPEDIGDAVGRRLAPGYGMTDARRASCRWQPLSYSEWCSIFADELTRGGQELRDHLKAIAEDAARYAWERYHAEGAHDVCVDEAQRGHHRAALGHCHCPLHKS